MSTTIPGGGLYIKDPESERLITFDWSNDFDAGVEFADSDFVVSGPDANLTTDNATTTGLTASVRLLGGTPGKVYTLTHRVVTNESPAQTDDESVRVLIQHQ
jgi:hypothetical protein